MELYLKYRPTTLKGVLGQDEAVRTLLKLLKADNLPHALLLSGPSGTGKTTLARILAEKVECLSHDLSEINCADFRGVDTVRNVLQKCGLSPMGGKSRVYIIDEAHQMTKDAQNALLKLLEDTPRHVYLMLCTTEPNKLINTIRTRCTTIGLRAIRPKDITALLQQVIEKEEIGASEEVLDRIVEVADGSARKALVILNQIMLFTDEEERLNAIQSSDTQHQAKEIALALLNPRTKWMQLSKILAAVEEEPESLRRLVLAFATNAMLRGGKGLARAYLVADAFRDHFYDSGRAGLVAACYEVLHGT